MKTLRYLVTLATFLIANINTYAAAKGIPGLNNPNTHKLTDRVYALIGDMDIPNSENHGFICNSAFVITDNGVVVVDPGGTRQIGEMVLKEIRKVTNKPITHIINTHHHADHWMGNDAFDDLPENPTIIGHAFMKQMAYEIGDQWIEIIGRMTKGLNKDTKVVLPTQTIDKTQTLTLGGMLFHLYHPEHAHTRGDLAVYLPDEKVLLTGDILFYIRTPGFQDASPKGNEVALNYLKSLDVDKVVPGHGPVTDKSGIKWMLDFVHQLRSEVKRLYAEGLEDFEMKEKINIGNYRNMDGFQERFGIAVNRTFLEVEHDSLSGE